MSGGFNMDDYVGVNERILAFKEKYPEGVLQSEILTLTDKLVVVKGLAYKTPDDLRPGIGHSSLAIPGATPYTRGSELENAETSAWGRALAALGFEVKRSVASRNEVESKQGEAQNVVPMRHNGNGNGTPAAPYRPSFAQEAPPPGTALKVAKIFTKTGTNKNGKPYTKWTIVTEDGQSFGTFSDTFGMEAARAKDKGLGVLIEAHRTQYGNDLDNLTVVEAEREPVAAGHASDGPPAPFDPDDTIPF